MLCKRYGVDVVVVVVIINVRSNSCKRNRSSDNSDSDSDSSSNSSINAIKTAVISRKLVQQEFFNHVCSIISQNSYKMKQCKKTNKAFTNFTAT